MVSEFFKNKQKFIMALSALFLVITLAAGSIAALSGDIPTMADKPESEDAETEVIPEDEPGEIIVPEDMEMEPGGGEEEDDFLESATDQFNIPSEMRGTFLVPGTDFLKTKDTSEATIRKEIDDAITTAKSLTINAVIVDTAYNDQVVYQTKDAPELSSDFDILGYIVEKARAEGFYAYAIFDASLYNQKQISSTLSVGAGAINRLSDNLTEFAEKYQLDGILIDGYQNSQAEESYTSYLSLGGGMGFENFMRQSPSATVKTASKTIRKVAPATQVGLLTDAVWENKDINEAGSATKAEYTSLSGGNADTKGFVEKGYVDFVAVKAYTTVESQSEPFKEVVSWWADVARQNDIPMYVVHATNKMNAGEAGWTTQDQLIKQVAEAADISGFRGSIFNSMQPLATNKSNVSDSLVELYTNNVEPEQILTQLEMTKPEKTEFTTSEPQVTFTGASDPGSKVTINDEAVATDESGYFTIQKSLKTGLNTFTVKHKDKTITYKITRKVELLREAAPMGDVSTEGGMSITISAVAYADAEVYATINGTTVQMSQDNSTEDEQDRDGSFRSFSGQYTVPAASGEVQNLGKIVVHASYDGQTGKIEVGNVKVNKKAKLEDGVAVRVVAEQALTYPPDTLDNVPNANYYPLPQGAMDYAVGDEITYNKTDSKGKETTYKYFVLASGLRVESGDITAISEDYPGNNAITGLSVKAEDGYTYITVKTAQKVSYSVKYASSGISFNFHNTTRVPSDMALSKNPLFTNASWSDTTLTLSFVKSGGFMGYKGYYDNSGNLVLRFNNPPTSLSGARIAIDPGHGGKDPGTAGFLSDYPESVINKAIAEYLASELESRGATVNLMNNDNIEGQQRKEAAEKWNADLFVSVHCNSAPNVKATGTEVYYFHSFNKTLASNLAKSVSSGYGTDNRGAKASYYHVSLSSQFQSVLVECGFLTNKDEYEQLVTKKVQQSIAVGIADGLSASIKGTSTGVSASGSESTGDATDTNTTDQESDGSTPDSGTTSSSEVEYIDIRSTLNVIAGKSNVLVPSFYPEEITDAKVTWKSSNTEIAKVDETGKVTGVAEGTTTITATSGTASSLCEVTVKPKDAKTVKVTDIELSDTEVVLAAGTSYLVKASVYPDDADDTAVTWKSNRSSVATVTATGRITGVKEGEAEITATTVDGRKKVVCTVYVTATSSSSGSTTDSGISLKDASDAYFDYSEVKVFPGTATRLEIISNMGEVIKGADFTWESEDTSVATVDSKGFVTGKKVGETYVTATATNGDYDYNLECYVIVSREKVAVTGISFEKTSISLVRSKSTELKVKFSPSNATVTSVNWSSADSKIATVDRNGKVTGRAEGTTTITAATKDGKYTATCTVEVTRTAVKLEEIELDEDLEFLVGEESELIPYFYPENSANTEVTWSSSNPSVVSVDDKGKIKMLKRGTARITVTSKESSRIKATCTITVLNE